MKVATYSEASGQVSSEGAATKRGYPQFVGISFQQDLNRELCTQRRAFPQEGSTVHPGSQAGPTGGLPPHDGGLPPNAGKAHRPLPLEIKPF